VLSESDELLEEESLLLLISRATDASFKAFSKTESDENDDPSDCDEDQELQRRLWGPASEAPLQLELVSGVV